MRQLDPLELITWRRGLQENPQYLDVRERWEFALCRLEDSINIPLGELAERYDEIDSERPVVCICHMASAACTQPAFLSTKVSSRW